MSTQTLEEVQADAARAEEALARDLLAQQAFAAYKQHKKDNKVLRAKRIENDKIQAQKIAAQIVRPSAPPQNLILTRQTPDPVAPSFYPGTPGFYQMQPMSPGAEYNAGTTMEDLYELYQSSDDEEIEVAVTAPQEAQLVMPHDLTVPVALTTNAAGGIVPESLIQPIFLQGRRPAVITDEEYEKRKNKGLYPNKFLRREYNVPYDNYLNERMWIVASAGYWRFEPNIALHPDEIAHEAQQARNLLEAKGKKSKTQENIEKGIKAIRKASGQRGQHGITGERTGLDKTQGTWLGNQKSTYFRPHLYRSDQMHEIDFRRVGSIAHAESDEYNQSSNFYATSAIPNRVVSMKQALNQASAAVEAENKAANDLAYQHWSDMATRMQETTIRLLNPQGLEAAPAGSVTNDFPVAMNPIIEDQGWDAPIPGMRSAPPRELTAAQEEEYYQSFKRRQARKRAHAQASLGRTPTESEKQKFRKDMLASLLVNK